MIIKVVGRRANVDFVTKEGVHIQGTSYFYLRERRGVEGYSAEKCFVNAGSPGPFSKLGADYRTEFNEYGKIDLSNTTLA